MLNTNYIVFNLNMVFQCWAKYSQLDIEILSDFYSTLCDLWFRLKAFNSFKIAISAKIIDECLNWEMKEKGKGK